MMLVFGLMLLLLQTSASLGHKLNLLNPRNTDNRIQKRINNNNTTDPVCRIKNGKMRETECDLYSNRPEVTVINGTLIINRVIRADSGNYTVTLFHCSGCLETSTDLQVNVEAPIGSVEVSIICSSSGTMRVSCSSEGDQILYSWTLNGDPLMDGNSSIDLDEGTDGNISCSVKNHVSHGQETVTAKPCPGLDRFCRFNQSDICYAALGHKLNLLNPGNTDIRIQKRINNNKTTDPVCRVKNGKMRETECDLYSNRPEVTVINGTLIINRVIRADSGNYTVTLFRCFRCSETSTDLQVNVEAPIGSVEVSIICSSSGTMRVSCSSEDDQILYSWTLNGDPLMDGNSSIDLDEGTDGNISCSVKNHVSHGQETVTAKPCPGLDRFCRFNQSDICYAALGHKLNLLNPRNTDNRIQKRINNNKTTDPVCRIKNGKMRETECDLYSNRPEVTVINGTLIINRVIRADSGNYTVTLFHCSGCSETSTDLQVNVEAPIGSVEVSIICSSSGMMRGSCSSEGDQILYSWTLNGDPLMDGNSSIDLDEGTDGNISCSVKNHVSHGQETVTAKPCPGPTTASVTSTVTKDSENEKTGQVDTSCCWQ
ncbi:uncharacterized protein LOC131552895 isoform X2 [Onychostoma macrolepis]|uniref:uncharacterized protein LOC131552895 isoform X2 n=1 Tax=Onychostoma macrolepis TaxID=369639 RepID=UPI00272BDEB0|nr:uncharacterized protein LOC131552895 isoform X2 [Onychostoma macrolepis]